MDQTAPQQTPANRDMPPKKNSGGLLAAIIIVVLILAGAAYALTRHRAPQNVQSPQQSTQSPQQNTQAQKQNSEAQQQKGPAQQQNTQAQQQPSQEQIMAQTSLTSPTNTAVNQNAGAENQPGVRTLTVLAQNYSFTPSTITVKKGDKVTIHFSNSGGMHDFVLDAFNVKTDIISAGSSQAVTFTADKTGSFPFFCSVGNHRAMGMQGTLIVQ